MRIQPPILVLDFAYAAFRPSLAFPFTRGVFNEDELVLPNFHECITELSRRRFALL